MDRALDSADSEKCLNVMTLQLTDYVESLQNARTIGDGFEALDREIIRLGFDGILYTYIPRILISSNFYRAPVFQVSQSNAPDYLEHYSDEELHKVDPMVQAVENEIDSPIDWWTNINNHYSSRLRSDKAVTGVSRICEMTSGITLPLMSDGRGIAGATLIRLENKGFLQFKNESFRLAEIRIKLYHNTVLSKTQFSGEFNKPILNSMSDTQLGYLLGIIEGDGTKIIAGKLKTTRAFLDQSMRKMRQRFSGVGETEKPALDRNQLMYYFGAANIAEHTRKKKNNII